MVSDDDLTRLLDDLESDRVERNASASDKEEIRKAICAFANDLPNHGRAGVVFVGANDGGTPAGLQVTDKLLRDLADIRGEGNLVPLPSMTVQKRTLKGAEIAVIIVEQSDAPPIRLRGRTWIRVGPRRDTATPDEERRLAEKRGSGIRCPSSSETAISRSGKTHARPPGDALGGSPPHAGGVGGGGVRSGGASPSQLRRTGVGTTLHLRSLEEEAKEM